MTTRMTRRHFLTYAGLSGVIFLAGCGKPESLASALKHDAHVLALGDSLTAGVGATPDQSWPAELARLTGWHVTNEGVSGDTSIGALRRLEALLAAHSYDAILIGIGGNDMLRRVSPQATRDNLAEIVRLARAHTPYVAVIATPAPDPLRASLNALSDAAFYQEIAMAGQALLIPGVYADVLSDAALRSDRIHANAKGYALIAGQLSERLKAAGWH